MYKVLFVDDEALIREAITENIPWETLGYQLTGACRNGKEAMDQIRKDPPDLLLTDINMPYMDGIQLAKLVYEEYKDTKVVILSGYDDFEYAKQAVKYQVLEYILKPITPSELMETLLRIKKGFDERRSKEESIQKIRGAYNRNLPMLQGRFLNSLLMGKIKSQEIREKMEDYQLELPGPCYMAVILEADDLEPFLKQSTEYQRELAYFAVYNIADEIIQEKHCGVGIQSVGERTVLIFQGNGKMEEQVLGVSEEILEAEKKYLGLDCTAGVGMRVPSLELLNDSYADAEKSLEFKFLLGAGQVIYARNLLGNRRKQEVGVPGYAQALADAIRSDSRDAMETTIREFCQAVRGACVTRNRSIFYVQNLLLSVMNGLDTSGLEEDAIYEKEQNLCSLIYQKRHLSEVAEELSKFCGELADSLHDEKDSYCKKQAMLAMDYIEKNYGDSQVSLNSVCAYLAMSTSYFSSIFKNYTGETFIEALTKKRIEKAKSLLKNTQKKTYEIAAEVGYGDPHYFSSAFKKMTGMTPREYAKKALEEKI